MTQLDYGQVLQSAYDEATLALKVKGISGALVTDEYNEIVLTYIAAGNGAGEIETAVFKNNGTTVATLTLTYNASNKLSSVVKS